MTVTFHTTRETFIPLPLLGGTRDPLTGIESISSAAIRELELRCPSTPTPTATTSRQDHEQRKPGDTRRR